ncbi:MAG: aromatic aminobenezylarsenical efflux permease ArsG family transporter [Candidatus Zixiibacteriota bacterium]
MESPLAAALMAIWLGILTSISPCPLATNIAAVSFIGRQVDKKYAPIWTGLLYMLGRSITYVAVGIIVTGGILTIPGVALFLQKYMNYLLGPLLILLGIILMEWLPIRIPGMGSVDRAQAHAAKSGLLGAALLGGLFALSFCPVSAGLFFGSLIPLSVRHGSYVILPSLYGIGTALPVFVCGMVIAYSAQGVGRLFHHMTQFERWARIVTALLFIGVGVYLCLRYIFQII